MSEAQKMKAVWCFQGDADQLFTVMWGTGGPGEWRTGKGFPGADHAHCISASF